MSKVALITGGSKRIGKAIVMALWNEGWDVIIHFNESISDAKKLMQNLNHKRSDSARCIKANLDNEKEIKYLIDESIKQFGSIDALINNASTFFPTPISKISKKNWELLINSNLKAPIFLIAGLKDVLKLSKGIIINITDINAHSGLSDHSIYIAAKSGLNAITKTFAKDLSPDIRVNAVAPGAILEPPKKNWTEAEKNKIIKRIPLQKMGDVEDIAETVKFLVNSTYITGQIINVDGGRSIN